jgi:glycosyltransferase involved in cell wall biosynthesis
VDSLRHQTFSDIEIILVDDGSTDDCPQICDAYEKQDSRIHVIHKENGGLVSARKAGLEAASGELIGYVDGDDWIEPDMYERLYRTLTEQDVDIVMCGRYEDTGDAHKAVCHGLPEGRYDKAAMQNDVYPRMIVNGAFFEWGMFPAVWDKLFRRECLEPFQMAVDERLTIGEDLACVFPCLLHAESIYIMRDCLYHYRQTLSSMVHTKEDKEIERMRYQVLYHSVLESFEKYKDIYDLREQWRDYMLFLMMPRADTLYEGVEKLDFLFPFPEVKRGMDIVLYGMGIFGQRLYGFIRDSGFCNIVLTADRNYKDLQKQGLDVASPEEIGAHRFDAIVVANSFAGVRKAICRDLSEKYPNAKLCTLDEKLLRSEQTLERFGLQ